MFAPICFCIQVSIIDLLWTVMCPLIKGIRRSFFSMGYSYWKGALTDCAGPIKYTPCSRIWKPCSLNVRQYLRNSILSSSLVVTVGVPLQEQIIFQSHPLGTDHLTCRRGWGGYGFFLVQKIFFGQHESYNIFFHNLTLGYMTKTLNQIFFPSIKIRICFSATLGIRILFFLEKNHNPPAS
jgi:hypothetical protein